MYSHYYKFCDYLIALSNSEYCQREIPSGNTNCSILTRDKDNDVKNGDLSQVIMGY